ncbi:MAG: hypothetical protein IT328_04025 [Caldilineaceae bacterium]|nr:hypothetical protein [Caldilineaceae bacterium]
MSAEATTQPIPISAEFPVAWEQPGDEKLFWFFDRMHTPSQSSPMDLSFWRILYSGFKEGHAFYAIPMDMRVQQINTFVYATNLAPPPTEEEAKIIPERIGATMGQLQSLWDDEWLPTIREHLAFWDGFDLSAASMPELITHLDESIERTKQLFSLHFRIVVPVYSAISGFDDFYQEVFGKESPFGSFALLEGFPNKTVEIGQALFRLSRQAILDPAVTSVLVSNDGSAEAELRQTEAGRRFLVALDKFLQEYGHRSELWSISYPSWIEDSTPVYRTLRDYLRQPDLDLDSDLAAAATRRDERIAAARAQLQGYPQPVVEQFEFLLRAAQVGTVLSEDHGFWIDFHAVDRFRQVIREFGRRLAAMNVIDLPDDVFFLTQEEMRATAIAQPMPDQRKRVAERKAEMQRFAGVQPPPLLGTPPAHQPGDSPAERADRKFFGGPPPTDSTPQLIRGNSGSPGKVQGRVKVVHSLAEASKLEQGDILVAVTTAPPWTPLFATAAAVITDTGGVLSHCAVVAREYGIPAVVGTGVATTFLHDDQWIEIDGEAGTVRVLEAV